MLTEIFISEISNQCYSWAHYHHQIPIILYKLGEVDEALNQWKKAKELGGISDFLNQKIEEGKLYE